MERLHLRDRKILQYLAKHEAEFVVYGRLPAGGGELTMHRFVQLGWVVEGEVEWRGGTTGWQITGLGKAAINAGQRHDHIVRTR